MFNKATVLLLLLLFIIELLEIYDCVFLGRLLSGNLPEKVFPI